MKYYSSMRKKDFFFYDNMDGPWGVSAKWNRSDKDKYLRFHPYMESKNKTSEKTKSNSWILRSD